MLCSTPDADTFVRLACPPGYTPCLSQYLCSETISWSYTPNTEQKFFRRQSVTHAENREISPRQMVKSMNKFIWVRCSQTLPATLAVGLLKGPIRLARYLAEALARLLLVAQDVHLVLLDAFLWE